MRKRESPTKPTSKTVTVPDPFENRCSRNQRILKSLQLEDTIKPSRVPLLGPLNVMIGFVIGILIRYAWRHVFVVVSYRCPTATSEWAHEVSSDKVDATLRYAAGETPIVTLQTPPKNYAYQPNLIIRSSNKLFQALPKTKRRTFYAHRSRINQGMIRALREQGWTQVNHLEDARFVYTYKRMKSWYPKLHPWQRYNHIPNTAAWNQKDNFAKGFRQWEERTGQEAYFVPETYDFNILEQKEAFRVRLWEQDGLQRPWVLKIPNVNQGKGITMLGPNSDELKNVLETVAKSDGRRFIIQQYICNEMTWERRKFDVRVYWLVCKNFK
jgi:hypothetical protein